MLMFIHHPLLTSHTYIAGSRFGLSLTLNIEQYDYMIGPQSDAGIKVGTGPGPACSVDYGYCCFRIIMKLCIIYKLLYPTILDSETTLTHKHKAQASSSYHRPSSVILPMVCSILNPPPAGVPSH